MVVDGPIPVGAAEGGFLRFRILVGDGMPVSRGGGDVALVFEFESHPFKLVDFLFVLDEERDVLLIECELPLLIRNNLFKLFIFSFDSIRGLRRIRPFVRFRKLFFQRVDFLVGVFKIMRHGIDFFIVFLFDQRKFGKFVVKFGEIFVCLHPREFRLLKF